MKPLALCPLLALAALAANAAPFEIAFDGKPLTAVEARISAVPFNRVWPGHQRDIGQTRLSHFVSFDVPAGGGELTVIVADGGGTARIRPFSRAQPVGGDGRWTVRVERPEQFVLEFGSRELHVFADPPWTYAPVPDEIYFGPGEHAPGAIIPKSGQTVTLDRGAVVYGNLVLPDVTNVTVRGRGILCGSRQRRVDRDYSGSRELLRRGWTGNWQWGTTPVFARRCRGLRLDGIVFRDAPRWTMNLMDCDGVDIHNVKIVGMWRYNSDGIDVCGCRDVTIRDSFVRSFDDCVVARPPCRRLRVENCVLWCDWNWNIKVQHSELASVMEDISFRDIKAVNIDHALAGVTTRWGSANSVIRDVRFADIEADVPPDRVRGQYQRGDAATFAPRPPKDLLLLLVNAYSLGKPAPNQGKPGPMDESVFRLRYDDIRAERFRVYDAPGRTVDELPYPITAEIVSVVPGHEIRNVSFADFPKGLQIRQRQEKGRISGVERR